MSKSNYMPRVIGAKYKSKYLIEVEFNNGTVKVIDFFKHLNGGIFEQLKDIKNFEKFFVDGWTISWPNGADLAPDTLYYEA
jgi:hypothetical protein